MPPLPFTRRHIQILGLAAIAVSALTWGLDLSGATYVCPYCRTQRTVIGLLGLGMLSPVGLGWIGRYLATSIGSLAVVVAAMQHFNGWRRISAGTFRFNETIYFDAFLLSGAALFILIGQIMLYYVEPAPPTPAEPGA